jgi:hypothetical protein
MTFKEEDGESEDEVKKTESKLGGRPTNGDKKNAENNGRI